MADAPLDHAAKLDSLRLHLSNLLREAAEVEKEIGRWEWEVAAVRKASRETAQAQQRVHWNAIDHGYAVSSAAQKRRRVVRWQDEEDAERRSTGWGPADEGAVATIGNPQYSSRRRARPLWECQAGEPIDVDEVLGEAPEEVDIKSDHSVGNEGGHEGWKLLDYIPRIKQTFEVVIPSRPPSSASTGNAPQPASPLFYEANSEDDSEDAEYISSDPEFSPQTLLERKKSNKTLCFSPLMLSAGSAVSPLEQAKDQQDQQARKPQHEQQQQQQQQQSFTPLSLLPNTSSPSTPLRMPTRLRPPSSPSVAGVDGSGTGKDESQSDPATPKRSTPKRSISPSSNPHSIGKTFVASPGFFGTFAQRRQNLIRSPLR